MTDAEKLTSVKLLLGIANTSKDPLLTLLLSRAKNYIYTYCNRSDIPAALDDAHLDLTVIYYNRVGVEGQQSHSEGSVSRSMIDVPVNITNQLNRYRLATIPI